MTDSPTEERQDSLFCSFGDSPLSQVDIFFIFDQTQSLAEQIDQVNELKRLCGLEDDEEAIGGTNIDHPLPTFQPITGSSELAHFRGFACVFFSDEDWDRMEALADQELDEKVEGEREEGDEDEIEEEEVEEESSVRAESLAKLEAFKENPHVDLNESKLATELKKILEEAQRRMEAGELEKKRKKEQKKVRIAEEAARKGESNIIMNVLKHVEQENGFVTEMVDPEMADEDNLLDGFMDGFNEEKEDEEVTTEEDHQRGQVENLDDKVEERGRWSFKLAATVALLSVGAAWLGGQMAKT